MKYSFPQIRVIAQRIPILCALYFVLFSFCFLLFLQRDILAQAQFQFSEGVTVYHPLLSAILCTFGLFLLGLFCNRMLPWLPLRMKATPWFLPFLLLGALTHWHFPQFGDTAAPAGWGTYLILLVAFVILLLIGRMNLDSFKERQTFSTYAWPNELLLLIFTVMCVCISNTDIVLHRTLQATRHLGERNYEKMLKDVQWEKSPSRQLSAMTALALSETGQLGSRLFNYAQPYGSEGLLPASSDTLLFVNLYRRVGYHLGYHKGDHLSTTTFLSTISTMPKATHAVRDYLLCAHLLDKNLDAFTAELLDADSLSATLPLHYQEAYVLHQRLGSTLSSVSDSIPDASLYARFDEFMSLYALYSDTDEGNFHTREGFGQTYWFYYFFTRQSSFRDMKKDNEG